MKLRRPSLTKKVARGLELLLSPPPAVSAQLGMFDADTNAKRARGVTSRDYRDLRRARQYLAGLIVWHREHSDAGAKS